MIFLPLNLGRNTYNAEILGIVPFEDLPPYLYAQKRFFLDILATVADVKKDSKSASVY